MTPVFFQPPEGPNDPQTHALVIGVGEYPHLRHGTLPPAPVTLGLGQLTSPPVSATAFANWLLDEFANVRAPLGSVEVLLSPQDFRRTGGRVAKVAAATMENITHAFDQWEHRCNSTQKNVAIFYFCGHGLEREVMLLLPEDFGAEPNRLWKRCIDFQTTWNGMRECKAETQCYFIDACRETPIDLLRAQTVSAQPLKSTSLTVFPDRDAYVLKAAPIGQKAFGPAHGVSYFTQGLLKCLRGLGAGKWDGVAWTVDTASLARAMVGWMRRTKLPDGRRASCAVGGESNFTTEIHTLPGPAMVISEIDCQPLVALGVAELRISDGRNPPRSRGPNPAPWELDLESGTYDVEAKFPGGQFRDAAYPSQIAHPPEFVRHLQVVP